MKHECEAVFENGVLRPLEPLPFSEHEHVTISILSGMDALLDLEFMSEAKAEADDSISIAQVRQQLASIHGSLSDAINQDRGEY